MTDQYDGPERRKDPPDPELVKAVTKAIYDQFYLQVGKSVVRKVWYLAGAIIIGLAVYGNYKGWWHFEVKVE